MYIQTGGIRMYAGNSLTFSAPEGYMITKIVLEGADGFSDNLTAEGLSNGTWNGSANEVIITGNTNKKNLTNATITLTEAGSVKPAPELSFSQTTAEATLGSSFTAPTLTTAPAGLTVAYSSSNTGVATVDASTGAVTLVAAGTTTITASFEGNDFYAAAAASYTLTVSEAPAVIAIPFYESFNTNDGTGGNDDAWSGSIASSNFQSDHEGWAHEKGSGANHCVKAGTSSAGGSFTTPTLPFETGKNYVLTFKAGAWNGNSEKTTLALSSTAGTLSQTSVTTTKGAWTEFTVYLTEITGAGTITFSTSAGNSRFFLDEVRVEESNIEVISTPIFSLEAGAYKGAQSVEISCTTEGANIYYTIDGSDPTAASNAYTTAISVAEATTIKAIAIKDESESEIATASYFITVGSGTESDPYTAADANLVAELSLQNVYVAGIISRIISLDVDNYPNARYYISADGTEENEFYVYNGKYLEGADFTANDQIQFGDEVVVFGNLTVYNGTKEFASGNNIVSLTHPLKLNAKGYATYADTRVLDFTNAETAGYTAWQVTGISGTDITFEQITGAVAAGTGVLLKGEAGATITMAFAQTGTDISATNKLEGITEATAVEADTYYGLSGEQFLKVKAGTVPAGKALLRATDVETTTGETKVLNFVFKSEADGVNEIANDELEMTNIYNLAGQRLQKLQRGVNIVGGKKIVVK